MSAARIDRPIETPAVVDAPDSIGTDLWLAVLLTATVLLRLLLRLIIEDSCLKILQ